MLLFTLCIVFLSPVTIISVTSLTLPNIKKFKESFLQTVDHRTKKTVTILQLQCTYSGTPETTVEFQYNGKKLSKNSTRVKYINENTVQIYNVSYITDEGLYKCMVQNTYGNVFDEKFIKIPTVGTFKPGEDESAEVQWHEVSLGQNYELVCPEHTHIYPLKYFWVIKNGEHDLDFITQNNPNLHTTKNGRLFITSVTKDIVDKINSKGVRCMLQMGNPDFPEIIYSRPIGLHFKKNATRRDIQAKIMYDIPGKIYVKQGDSVTLECLASGSPLPTIKWFRNGVQIYGNDSDYVINDAGTVLTIKNVNKTKLGQIICEAQNTLGSDKRSGNLILAEPARLTTTLRNVVTVPQGNKLRLKCEAAGTFPVKYYWYKNGSLLTDYCYRNVCVKIDNGELVISYVNRSDEGQYQCTAKNAYGSDNSFGRVVVTKPEVKSTVNGKNVSNNGSKNGGGDNTGNETGPKPDPNGHSNATRNKTKDESPLSTQHIIIIACGGTVFCVLFAAGIMLYCRTKNDSKEVRFIPTPRHELHKPIFTEPDNRLLPDFPPPPKSFTDSDDDDLSSFGGAKMNHQTEFINLMSDRYKQTGISTNGTATPEHLYYDIPEDHHSANTTPITEL